MLQLTSTDNTEPLPILENLFRALEPGLPVIFGLMGAFALFYTIRKIHKSQMNIEDSIT